jgi:hypothetical protein
MVITGLVWGGMAGAGATCHRTGERGRGFAGNCQRAGFSDCSPRTALLGDPTVVPMISDTMRLSTGTASGSLTAAGLLEK